MAEHTPTPYRVHAEPLEGHPEYHIYHIVCDRGLLCTIDTSNEEQDATDAAYIVRACNSHEALLAACDWVLRYAKNTPEGAQWMVSDPSGFRQFETAIAAARGDA